MKFVTFLTDIQDIHLSKDVVSIPYFLKKNNLYDSSLLTYKYREEVNIKSYKQYGLKINNIPNRFGFYLDNILYLKKNSKKIDILNLYHVDRISFFQSIVYKIFNHRGKLYIKMDCDKNDFDRIYMSKFKRYVIFYTLYNLANLITVESSSVLDYIHVLGFKKVKYLSNGFDINYITDSPNFSKENIILTVGRIGTYQKATDFLLNSLIPFFKNNREWKLYLVGPIETNFNKFIENFFLQNPDLKDSIIFFGEISDKQSLMRIYQKSKIFVLPSRFESFGLVLLEALANGCYLVMSDSIPPAKDLLVQKINGTTFQCENSLNLYTTLNSSLENCLYSNENNLRRINFVKEKYDWNILVKQLYRDLEENL